METLTPHVLFAEDDADTRELVQVLLTVAGFRVSVTSNPTEALHLAANKHFDALLLDNWMQDVTGVELCRRIRSFDQLTPILFCSGAVAEGDIKEATLAGAQGYISKPFDPDDLVRALRAAIKA